MMVGPVRRCVTEAPYMIVAYDFCQPAFVERATPLDGQTAFKCVEQHLAQLSFRGSTGAQCDR
jgi:hypothetical protein